MVNESRAGAGRTPFLKTAMHLKTLALPKT